MEFGEVENEASYICDNCGEEIVVPLDITAGHEQHYVEDCPVCCSPNVLIVASPGDRPSSIGNEKGDRLLYEPL